MSSVNSLDGFGFARDACVFDDLFPGSPFAGVAEFGLEALEATFDECVLSAAHTICQPTVAAQHSTIAKAQPAEDVFDALDAFLEAEFPMGDPRGQSPIESYCWTAAETMSPVPTPSPQPAHSASSSGTDVTAPVLCSPFESISNIPASQSPCAQSEGAIAAAVSAIKGASSIRPVENNSPLPHWTIYHMQQRQALLAPKQPSTTPASSGSADSAATDTAQVGATTPAAPAACASTGTVDASTAVTGVTLPVARTNSVTSNFTGSIMVPLLSPATLTAEHVLLLKALQQQQQLQLLQQQQVLLAKRNLATADFGVPQAKRCRTAAAGCVAAEHLYGLRAPEPVNQLQELHAVQLQLQERILHSHQQQIANHQQQQLQALHQQLHMRLQMQQHQ